MRTNRLFRGKKVFAAIFSCVLMVMVFRLCILRSVFFSAGNLTSTFGKCVSLSACVVSGKRARCKENSQILFHCLLALFGCKTFPHSINNNVYNADIND